MLGTLLEKVETILDKFISKNFPRVHAFLVKIHKEYYQPIYRIRSLFSPIYSLFSFLSGLLPSIIVGGLSGAGAGGVFHQVVVKPQVSSLKAETSQLQGQISQQGEQNKKMAVVLANQEKNIQKTNQVVGQLVVEAKTNKVVNKLVENAKQNKGVSGVPGVPKPAIPQVPAAATPAT